MAPYLTLMTEDAAQREHSLREVFNGLRYIVASKRHIVASKRHVVASKRHIVASKRHIVRTGVQWRMMANDLPPWHTVYQQMQRWRKAGVFEDMVRDLRMLMREIEGRTPQPRVAILDSRTLQSSPESGGRAGQDRHKRCKRRSSVRRRRKARFGLSRMGAMRCAPITSERQPAGRDVNQTLRVTASRVFCVFRVRDG